MPEMHGAMHGEPHASTVGMPGKSADVARTVEIRMNNSMRFVSDAITVKAGETIRFFIRNTDKVPHTMVIGSMTELKEHAEMMRNMPGMQHAEANMITLKPGQRGGLVWKFDQPGSVDFACLVPGHLEEKTTWRQWTVGRGKQHLWCRQLGDGHGTDCRALFRRDADPRS